MPGIEVSDHPRPGRTEWNRPGWQWGLLAISPSLLWFLMMAIGRTIEGIDPAGDGRSSLARSWGILTLYAGGYGLLLFPLILYSAAAGFSDDRRTRWKFLLRFACVSSVFWVAGCVVGCDDPHTIC